MAPTMTDTDRLEFLECFIRNKMSYPDLCAEMGLKDTTARMRMKSIVDTLAKRRAEVGNGEASGSDEDGAKAKGGKKKAAPKAKADGAEKKKATPRGKKRKVEEVQEGEAEAEAEAEAEGEAEFNPEGIDAF